MSRKNVRAAPRLVFTAEERGTAALEKSIARAEQAARQRDRMKAKLRKKHGPQKPKRTAAPTDAADAPAKQLTQRLHFDDEITPAPGKPSQGLVKQTIRGAVYRQIAQDEDEHTGLQAADTAGRTGETLLHQGKQAHQAKLQHNHQRLEKAEKRLDHANIRFLQKAQEIKRPETAGSNPISRTLQRRAIKKEYLAARAGKPTGTAAGKAVKQSGSLAEKVGAYAARGKKGLLVFALVGMMALVLNAISSCTPLVEAGLHTLVMGTYPATEEDVRAAERAYAAKERELQDELDHYESRHPGYDEYHVSAQDIWHDPYVLIAIISAYYDGEEWTIDDAYPVMEKYFGLQYVLTEDIQTEIRYRTEQQTDHRLMTDPDTGETRLKTYTQTVDVPYSYTICTVTLENRNLSHMPVYSMSHHTMGMYALYMSTHGNMEGIFAGNPYATALRDPWIYDIPQETLDADSVFARLMEEANKYVGYPYVWGGASPETSFDCSGFVSYVLTNSGVYNTGRLGATGLYGLCRKVTAEDVRPGDLVFFEGTMGDEVGGITHVGIYVGDNKMIHCGSPIGYADLTESYWRQHFFGYGRIPF